MKSVNLQLRFQPAPANLLRTAVCGMGRSVYVPVSYINTPTPGPGECVWTDGVVSLFAKANHIEDGLVVDMTVIVDPPPPRPRKQPLQPDPFPEAIANSYGAASVRDDLGIS